jgi:chemotaxis protein histidine kinase CheA
VTVKTAAPLRSDVGKYTRLFIDETRRHLGSLGEILNALSGGRGNEDLFFEGRRIAHSIKGMALFEEQQDMADLAYAMETCLEGSAADGVDETRAGALKAGAALLMTMIGEVERDGSAVSNPGAVIAAIE